MGLDTKMNDSERGLFALHGLTGMLIAVVLLLSILGTLTYFSFATQKANAESYYTINQDLNGLKMNDPQNHTMRQMAK
jgi:succinate dehydrogenase/fumarate reductase cytochrome b subunit